jgi:dolichol-phosphate mannosyltransferase
VILASLNEESGIGKTLTDLKEHLSGSKILVVDGKSKDRTVEIAKKQGATVIYQNGLGKGNAIACAIRYIDAKADYVVFTDADFTYPAKYVPKMISLLEQNPQVGMVCGDRLTWQTNGKIFYGVYYFGNKVLALASNVLSRLSLRDPLSGLRVIRSEILREWQIRSQGFDIEIELNHHVKKEGFSIMEVPIDYRQRLGEKKLRPVDGLTIFKSMVFHSVMDLRTNGTNNNGYHLTQQRMTSIAQTNKS